MFTGLIQELGTVISLESRSGGLGLWVTLGSLFPEAKVGDSISICGTCLTLEEKRGERNQARFFLSEETLSKTWLGSLAVGSRVNLEPSLRVGDSLGGHFVQGHVDGVGKVTGRKPVGEGEIMSFELPRDLERYLLPKGSIAVEGVSLTIVDPRGGEFSAALIPETLRRTNLGLKKPGDPVNIEADALGKWVAHLGGHNT